jgi:hypothetical protein
MVEHAKKIQWEGETDDTPIYKRKREEEETDSDYSPAFKREMQLMDDNMCRANQKRETRTQATACRLEFELENLNATVVHEIRETSSAAIMEISDDSDSG